MNDKRSNSVIVALVAALVIPRIQKLLGVVLTIDDIAGLMAVAVTGAHAICAVFERYFPPPAPRAVEPATTTPFVNPSPGVKI